MVKKVTMDCVECKVFNIVRILLGWTFLWAFVDKLWGLGFATAADKSWLSGVSPTTGFLQFASKGPLSGIFHSVAGSVVVDWLFMLGLLLIGFALLLGVGRKVAGYMGAVLMVLIWLAVLPPEHNPIVDEHIIYAVLLVGLARTKHFGLWSLHAWWKNTVLVKKYAWLE